MAADSAFRFSIVASKNYFDTLGLPESVDLDPAMIEARYQELALRFHPDRVSTQAPSARRQAVEMTVEVNEAYHALRNPTNRALHLLTIHGLDLGQEGAIAAPPELLEAVMEKREALETAIGAGEPEAISALSKRATGLRDAALVRGTLALREQRWEEAALHLVEVKYWKRFLEEAQRGLERQPL